jgi:hypothetical protein
MSRGLVYGFDRDFRCLVFPQEQLAAKDRSNLPEPVDVLDFAPTSGAPFEPLCLFEIPGTDLISSLVNSEVWNDPLPKTQLRTRRVTGAVQLVTFDRNTRKKSVSPEFKNQVVQALPSHDGKRIVLLSRQAPQIRVLSIPDFQVVREVEWVFDSPLAMAVF